METEILLLQCEILINKYKGNVYSYLLANMRMKESEDNDILDFLN